MAHYDRNDVVIHRGDSLEVLKALPDESVHCCVTSPPYYRQRDYGVDGQIGLESTPEEYVSRLVSVFREVRRVIRNTCWIVIGDKYASGGNGGGGSFMKERRESAWQKQSQLNGWRKVPPGYKDKDLLGIPWMLAFALRDDGWYLRSEIIWAKPNPLPESCIDRPTRSHETIFLLSKSNDYWYDAEAIKEPATDTGRVNGRDGREENVGARPPGSNPRTLKRLDYSRLGRNKRTIWSVPVAHGTDEHFATFPEGLIEPCILAGCPKGGTVLDPFGGSGTTAVVARKLWRRAVLIELNEAYCDMAVRRIEADILPMEEAWTA